MDESGSLSNTILWFLFCVLWAAKSMFLRHKRRYVQGRALKSQNLRFKIVSYFVFAFQIAFVSYFFWSNSWWLLKFHESNGLTHLGFLLCYFGLALYMYATLHLGRNYSPCFDSHLPLELIDSGPYRLIRHPGWLAKLLVGLGGLLVSGSLWLLLVLGWLLFEMRQTIESEEKYLLEGMPSYAEYRRKTKRLIPFIY